MPEELNYRELPLYKNLLVELEVEADFWDLDIDFDKLSPETDLKDTSWKKTTPTRWPAKAFTDWPKTATTTCGSRLWEAGWINLTPKGKSSRITT